MRKLINMVESITNSGSSGTISDHWFNDGSFQAFKIPDKREPFTVAQDSGVIKTLEGPVKYKVGDYIMTGPHGENYPIGPDTFRHLKTDNGDGTASPKKIIKLVKLADHDGHVILQYNGSKLDFNSGKHYIVKHGPGDYGAVQTDIFDKTYERVK